MADLDLATILADGEYLRRVGDTLDGGPGGSGVDAEGAVDAAAAAFAAGTHTNVTVTYDDTAGSISLASTSSGGSTILDGAGQPDVALGAVGNYYEDRTAGILYGPKSASGWGTEQRITITGAPDNAFGGQDESGVQVRFGRSGRVRKVRYGTLSGSTDLLTIKAWNDSTQTKVAEVADTQTATGSYEVTFPTPVPVAAGETWTFTLASTGDIPYRGSGAAVTNTADVTFLAYRTHTTINNWPNTTVAGGFSVEPIFEPNESWPVTVRTVAGYTTATRTITVKTSTANTGIYTDAGCYLRFTGTNPTYTVPPNSAVVFPVGTQIDGTGTATAMTLIAGAGVTITKARTLVTVGAGSGWTLIKTGTDTWDLHGDLI